MNNNHKRNRIFLMSILYLIFFTVFGTIFLSQYSRYRSLNSKLSEKQIELSELIKQEEQLNQELIKISDDNFVTVEINDQYGQTDKPCIIFDLPDTDE